MWPAEVNVGEMFEAVLVLIVLCDLVRLNLLN